MPEVTDSIMLSIKKMNNVDELNEVFDPEILMYINGALADLNQLGIGPSEGYYIEGEDDTWEDFLGDDPRFNGVRLFVGLYVRMRFDPPTTSFAIQMMNDQLEEHKFRLIVLHDDILEEEVE